MNTISDDLMILQAASYLKKILAFFERCFAKDVRHKSIVTLALS